MAKKELHYCFEHNANVDKLSAETEQELRKMAAKYGLDVQTEDPHAFHLTGKGADIHINVGGNDLRVDGNVGMPASLAFGKIRAQIEKDTPKRISRCEELSANDRSTNREPSDVSTKQITPLKWRSLEPKDASRYEKDYRYDGEPDPGAGLSFVVDLSKDDYGRFLRLAALIDVHMQEFATKIGNVLQNTQETGPRFSELQSTISNLEKQVDALKKTQAEVETAPQDEAGVRVRRLWLVAGGLALFGLGAGTALLFAL